MGVVDTGRSRVACSISVVCYCRYYCQCCMLLLVVLVLLVLLAVCELTVLVAKCHVYSTALYYGVLYSLCIYYAELREQGGGAAGAGLQTARLPVLQVRK